MHLRCTVLFPAVLAASAVFGQGRPPASQSALAAAALLQPAAVLIDHGHFQYNNICLGLAVSTQRAHTRCPGWLACVFCSRYDCATTGQCCVVTPSVGLAELSSG